MLKKFTRSQQSPFTFLVNFFVTKHVKRLLELQNQILTKNLPCLYGQQSHGFRIVATNVHNMEMFHCTVFLTPQRVGQGKEIIRKFITWAVFTTQFHSNDISHRSRLGSITYRGFSSMIRVPSEHSRTSSLI